MSWQEACQQISMMYRTVRGSVILPVYNFDFWCIPYLLGCGLTKSQIYEFVKGANSVMIDELNGGRPNARTELARLARPLGASGALMGAENRALREHPYP